jgi:hypothetical protein
MTTSAPAPTQQQNEQRGDCGGRNDGGWQGGKMVMGPNDIVVVWAPGEFFSFISCFKQLIKYICLIFRIETTANDENQHEMAHTQTPPRNRPASHAN